MTYDVIARLREHQGDGWTLVTTSNLKKPTPVTRCFRLLLFVRSPYQKPVRDVKINDRTKRFDAERNMFDPANS